MAGFADKIDGLRPSAGKSAVTMVVPWLVAVGVALVLHFGLKPHLDDYDAGLAMNIGINIILAVSLTIVNGFTGQFSIGHAGFLGVGGYVAGAITYYGSLAIWGNAETHGSVLSERSLHAAEAVAYTAPGDWLFVGAILAGGLVAAGLGFIVGLPSLRLKGDYLAIVTLGFGEIVRVLIQQTRGVIKPGVAWDSAHWWQLPISVGGSLGFSATPKYTSMFWVALLAAVTLVVAYRIKVSTYGRAFLSIREDEIAAEAMGVNTTKYKVQAFMIAAFFAGIAGGLYGHFKSMNPNEIGFARSFDIVIMVVLGGLGSISGATLAAGILTLLPEWLRGAEVETTTLFAAVGAVMLTVSIVRRIQAKRKGLTGRADRRKFIGPAVGAMLIFSTLARGHLPAALQTTIKLGDYRMILYSLILIVMMIARPKGLFGVREIWNVGPWARKARSSTKPAASAGGAR